VRGGEPGGVWVAGVFRGAGWVGPLGAPVVAGRWLDIW